jgi:hypothetical protein
MHQLAHTICRCLATSLLLTMAIGCQQNSATVTGIVRLDGKPLTIGSDERGTIVFQPASGQGPTATGILDPGGHFKLSTGASSEIQLGKYQVAISVSQLAPVVEGAEQGAKRITPAKYASPGTSGFSAEVVPGVNDFKFDLVSSSDDVAPNADGAGPTSSAGDKPGRGSP